MTDEEAQAARKLTDRWYEYFRTHPHAGDTNPLFIILRTVVRYTRHLEERSEPETHVHTREGWWSRFMKILGDS